MFYISWILLFIMCVLVLCLIQHIRRLENKITYINQHHQEITIQRMIDLKKVCHNINTPLSSIVTVLEIFNLQLYGQLPPEYVKATSGASEALQDLKYNLKDIQHYCDEQSEKSGFSMVNLDQNNMTNIDDPYIVNA